MEMTHPRSRQRISGWFVVATIVAVTVVTAALAAVGSGPHFTEVIGVGSVSIPGASLKRGEIRFFSYRDHAGKEIHFILSRDEAGHVLGAIDACQVCARYRRGYTTSGAYLVCRYRGNRYKLDDHRSGTSCEPVRFPVRESGWIDSDRRVTARTAQGTVLAHDMRVEGF